MRIDDAGALNNTGRIMKILFIPGVAIVFLAAFTVGPSRDAVADEAPAPGHHRSMEIRAALLDAHLAGLSAGLKLGADQQKNWPAFETAVRAVAKDRADRLRQMRKSREDDEDEQPSLIDRMRRLSDRLAQRSLEVKTIADAAGPLYASLDDGQKRVFDALFREFVRAGRHGPGHDSGQTH